jgi:putative transposase
LKDLANLDLIRIKKDKSENAFSEVLKKFRSKSDEAPSLEEITKEVGAVRKARYERNFSKLGKAKYIHPDLLQNLFNIQPNQVWAIDITYIPMKMGFIYLTAIIDVYSRFIVGWQISNSLEKETQTALLLKTIEKYGKPQIINSDQGAQYTCEHWVSTLQELEIRISMDGKGRATDNAIIERFFGTLKRKHIYLNPAENGLELYNGIDKFIKKYNVRNPRGINRKKPQNLYFKVA